VLIPVRSFEFDISLSTQLKMFNTIICSMRNILHLLYQLLLNDCTKRYV